VILLGQRPRIEDAHELDVLGDTQVVGLPSELRLQLRVVIDQPEMNVALPAKPLHRVEQEVDPLPVDQLADVEHVVALLVGSLAPMSGGAKDVGGNAVGNGVDLVGARHPSVVPGLGARQRDVGLRLVHHVLEGVAPQPRALPAGGDQPVVAGEDDARPAARRRHLEGRPTEVMDVNDVVVVRRLKAGVADRVHRHAGLAEAVEQHRLRCHQLLGPDRLRPIEDAADQADVHANRRSRWPAIAAFHDQSRVATK